MTTPLTHGTNDNPSESGTTRCGLAFDPETRLYVVGPSWTLAGFGGASTLPPPCPTCFPAADDNAELRGLAEAREALAAADTTLQKWMLRCGWDHVIREAVVADGVEPAERSAWHDAMGLGDPPKEWRCHTHGHPPQNIVVQPWQGHSQSVDTDHLRTALAEVDRLRAENEGLRAGDIPDRIRNEPAMYAAYCYAKRERRDEVEELRDRIAQLEGGWANARDTILNERHQLAEENFGSERINMVLGVLDDNYPEAPK